MADIFTPYPKNDESIVSQIYYAIEDCKESLRLSGERQKYQHELLQFLLNLITIFCKDSKCSLSLDVGYRNKFMESVTKGFFEHEKDLYKERYYHECTITSAVKIYNGNVTPKTDEILKTQAKILVESIYDLCRLFTKKALINQGTSNELESYLCEFNRAYIVYEENFLMQHLQPFVTLKIESKCVVEKHQIILLSLFEGLRMSIESGLIKPDDVESFDPSVIFNLPKLSTVYFTQRDLNAERHDQPDDVNVTKSISYITSVLKIAYSSSVLDDLIRITLKTYEREFYSKSDTKRNSIIQRLLVEFVQDPNMKTIIMYLSAVIAYDCFNISCNDSICTSTIYSKELIAECCPFLCDCRKYPCNDGKKCANVAVCIKEPCDAESFMCVDETEKYQ
ncbi:hypothetical protein O9G_003800 [Rozella allomycis CSF55]|uniref:Uncharacterized protein n=1 Tax=Rozella allomycis (strain CSF55) TaxID=988480 RepID=A0A075AVE4_ROZAC|nr:hypothetical protein O9G_003800 [Rozella allomycis CSF55]|eukprot:EPZ32672.1 hypothetical protein O9G_003800 [Rozella allomycis CSF55]